MYHASYTLSNRKKSERQSEYRRTGTDTETVQYYDIAAGTLEKRPIATIYGAINLYGEQSKPGIVAELEQKIAVLEKDASDILGDLHKTLGVGKFRLKRKALNRLRKFLFLMHYRRDDLSVTYFQEDHPHSLKIRPWTEEYKRKHGLQNAREVWLHVLRYYLDTSHSQISLHGEEMIKKYGMSGIGKMMNETHMDPEAEHYPALAYVNQAGSYFLCMWEAADGEEFVLGHNSFGLWEGTAMGQNGLHRLFVISPRVALVLRGQEFLPQLLPFTSKSLLTGLGDIKTPPPQRLTGATLSPGQLSKYRNTTQAEEDLFSFEVTKLTKAQTYAVNGVTLKNARDDGSITFASKDCMLRTLRQHCNLYGNFFDLPRYRPLIRQLNISNSELAPVGAVPDDDTEYEELKNILMLDIMLDHLDRAQTSPTAMNTVSTPFKEHVSPPINAWPISDGRDDEDSKPMLSLHTQTKSVSVQDTPTSVHRGRVIRPTTKSEKEQTERVRWVVGSIVVFLIGIIALSAPR